MNGKGNEEQRFQFRSSCSSKSFIPLYNYLLSFNGFPLFVTFSFSALLADNEVHHGRNFFHAEEIEFNANLSSSSSHTEIQVLLYQSLAIPNTENIGSFKCDTSSLVLKFPSFFEMEASHQNDLPEKCVLKNERANNLCSSQAPKTCTMISNVAIFFVFYYVGCPV